MKVLKKKYSLPDGSFANALNDIIQDLDATGKKYRIIHVENEKRYSCKTTPSGTPYTVQYGGLAVVLADFE